MSASRAGERGAVARRQPRHRRRALSPRHRSVPSHARAGRSGDPARCGTAPRRSGSTGRKAMSLEERQRDLDPNDPNQAAFMLAIRRAGAHASYAPFRAGRAAVAFGDARDLCPCDRAAAAARRPLRHAGGAGGRQRPRGAGWRHRRLRAPARGHESGRRQSRAGRQRGPGACRGDRARRPGWRRFRRSSDRSRRTGRADPARRSGGDHAGARERTVDRGRRPPSPRSKPIRRGG